MLLSDGELIHPWVAHAFSEFSHNHMLWLTHHLQTRSISAGAPVFDPSTNPPGICLVTGGNLEIPKNGHPASQEQAVRLCPGEYFSLLDYQHNGNGIPALQADSQGPATLLVVDAPQFENWINNDPSLPTQIRSYSALKSVHSDKETA
jgi:hypothetical protein